MGAVAYAESNRDMSTNGITIDELIAEWRKCETSNGGMTTKEICKLANLSPATVRKILEHGIEQGLIVAGSERRTTPLRPNWHFQANVFRVVEK